MASRLASCFPCQSTRKKEVPPSPPADPRSRHPAGAAQELAAATSLSTSKKEVPPSPPADPRSRHPAGAAPRTFSFEELAAATSNFSDDCRVVGWEGLYKGYLESINQVVAIRLQPYIHRDGSVDQENMEFLAHVLKISALRHPNLQNLIGFCADGDHRILVHEYMPLGSLEDHLHDPSPGRSPLDWSTRMTIAAGVARGLKYMHEKGVFYTYMRSPDILLGDGYHPKLSLYILAEHDQRAAEVAKGWNTFLLRDVTLAEDLTMGRPESSVYGFGVMLLEMITGRRVYEDQHLVSWAQPFLRARSQSEICRMADPALQGRYPSLDLQRAAALAGLCIQKEPDMRAHIDTIVNVLSPLKRKKNLAYDVDRPESSHHAAPMMLIPEQTELD